MGEAKHKRRARIDPAIKAMADGFEARGLTSPDKHDMLLAVFGDRVRVAEVGATERGVETRMGESMVSDIERMLTDLPEGHCLGMLNVSIGADYDCDAFLAFVKRQAELKGFTFMTVFASDRRSSKDIFDGFFDAIRAQIAMYNSPHLQPDGLV